MQPFYCISFILYDRDIPLLLDTDTKVYLCIYLDVRDTIEEHTYGIES